MISFSLDFSGRPEYERQRSVLFLVSENEVLDWDVCGAPYCKINAGGI